MHYLARIWLRLMPGVFTAGETAALLLVVLGLTWLTAVAAPAASISPEALSRAVERELRADPFLHHADLYAISRGSEVALGGTVDRPLWQRRAERVAETVRGVSTVVNHIVIQPPTHVSDRELHERLHRLLTSASVLHSATAFEVEVQGGKVRVRGEVASFAEREWAEERVASVAGIRSVRNELRIAPGRFVDDLELAEAVRRNLAFDALLDDERITVSVIGNRVQLSGSVRSAAERRRAHMRAADAGAAEVDVSRLDVSHEQRWTRHKGPGDEDVAQAVQKAFATSPRLQAHMLTVRVKGGNVELSGTVPTLLDKEMASRVAHQVRGVRQVRNHLTIHTDRTDQRALELHVRQALRADPLVGDQPITAKVRKQVAMLTGDVAMPWQRQHAEAVVAAIAGIREIRNELRDIQSAPCYCDKPYAGTAYFPAGNNTRLAVTPRVAVRDETLAGAVRAQLQWSPFVDVGDVRVSAHRGVVTLTGKVSTPFQASMATQEAYEGGAVLVKNLLSVKAP